MLTKGDPKIYICGAACFLITFPFNLRRIRVGVGTNRMENFQLVFHT